MRILVEKSWLLEIYEEDMDGEKISVIPCKGKSVFCRERGHRRWGPDPDLGDWTGLDRPVCNPSVG